MFDNRPTRDEEFASSAKDYLAAFKAYAQAKKDAERAKEVADECSRRVDEIKGRLEQFVGRSIPTKNALIGGVLVRVNCRGDYTNVSVEDVIG